ncbi:sugar phosphate isomerase/epimerase family protein [Armatimonas sp.]|uniref:sugar phosphate isomerase/epimerase family protein n=1 Tax=Armatimonas sp. TaxID=1872638 RepID=UPI003751927C
MINTPRCLSVSTWALHELIGTVAPGRPGDLDARLMPPREGGTLDLLHVPRELAKRNIRTMELCHFHLPDTSDCYLEEWAAAREEAGVALWSLLIDDGDINHPEFGDRDRDWVIGWLDKASQLGAKCVRIIGGKQPLTEVSLAKSIAQLRILTMEAYVRGVHVMIENWFPTLSTPTAIHTLMEQTGGSVGMTFDFGNWGGPEKYENLAQIVQYAEGCHAKWDNNDDFLRCLEITRAVNFSGPYTLVYGAPGAVWESLERQKELVLPYVA